MSQRRAALGTECVSFADDVSTGRAGPQERVAHDEVKDDSDSVGNEDRQQGPHDVAHPTPPGIAVNVPDE